MLTSLFGDLGPRDGKNKPRDFDDTQPDSQGGFAATAIMESVATEVNERGQIIDRHVSDLVVTGSPAQAIREHFAATREWEERQFRKSVTDWELERYFEII